MGLAQVEFAGRDYDPGFIVSGLPGKYLKYAVQII